MKIPKICKFCGAKAVAEIENSGGKTGIYMCNKCGIVVAVDWKKREEDFSLNPPSKRRRK